MLFSQDNKNVQTILVAIVAAVVVLAVVSGIASYSSVYNESLNTLQHQNRALIHRIDGWIESKVNLVNYNAKLLRDPYFPGEMIYPFFSALVAANQDLSDVYVGLPDGSWISGTLGGARHDSWVSYEQPWYTAAVCAPGRAVFIPPYWDTTQNHLAFASVRTVLDDSCSAGVVAVNVPFTTMATYIDDANELYGSVSFILDAQGYILFHPEARFTPDQRMAFHNAFYVDDGMHAEMARAVLGGGFFVGNNIVYVGSILSTTGWVVVTRVPSSIVMENVSAVLWSIFATVLIAVLGVGMGFAALSSVRRALQKMRESDERANLLLESVPVACYFLDSDCNPLDCNHTAVQLFTHEPDTPFSKRDAKTGEMLSCNWDCETCAKKQDSNCVPKKYLLQNSMQIIHGKGVPETDGKEWVRAQCDVALRDGIHQFEREHEALFGEKIPCSVTIIPLVYRGENAFACYLQDLRQSRLFAAETHMREIAQEESRAKTRFLARMSHEIRTPMNAVLGVTELQLRRGGHPQATRQAFLSIKNSSNMLLAIISDLLDLSKVEFEKLQLVEAEYDTLQLIAETMQINRLYGASKDISFDLDIDPKLPATLTGDELRIKQILNNLLSNAFKYTSEGAVSLTVRTEPSGEQGMITLALVVKDTGQGMTEEQVDNLFAEFTRFNLQYNTRVEGAGLGMPIVQHLIKLMRGTIKVESTPRVGTMVVVRIMQALTSADCIGSEGVKNFFAAGALLDSGEHTDDIEPMPGGSVLVVDDVEINIDVVEGMLDLYEISVDRCLTGRSAVERIAGGRTYDIIFMDHMMPDMDGIETTRAIRALGYTGPVIALTANAMKDTEVMFMQNGFSGFISKPIDFDELERYLEEYVRARD